VNLSRDAPFVFMTNAPYWGRVGWGLALGFA
jgi:hypothetical protein